MSLGLGSPSEDSVALLGIGEDLTIEDLKFPVLFDESGDDDEIIRKGALVGGLIYACALRGGYALWSRTPGSSAKRDERGRRPFPVLQLPRW